MVPVMDLWLAILLAAVLVFIASSILHMVLPFHRGDYRKLPDEEKLMEAMRIVGVPPGNYAFPCPKDPQDMGSPEMLEKYKKGPVGMVNIMPTGAPNMAKFLAFWFVYCIVIGIVVAYVTGRCLGPGAEYLAVFQIAGTAAFLGYAGGHAQDSIWKGQSWGTTIKHVIDGLIYALLTAGVFEWLWP